MSDSGVWYPDKEKRMGVEHVCWCGGNLTVSVHPAYGRCVVCGTLATWNIPTDKELRERYSFDGYWHECMKAPGQIPIEERVENDLRDRIPQWWEILHRHVPNCQSLLEIGCAHGMFLRYAKERGVEDVCGVEPDERTCVFARQISGANIASGLFPSDCCLRRRAWTPFDAIVMFDVLEHISHPAECAFDLSRSGALIIQTPEYNGQGADWPQFKPAEHLWLFTRESMRKLLERWGLSVVTWECPVFGYDQIVVGRRAR